MSRETEIDFLWQSNKIENEYGNDAMRDAVAAWDFIKFKNTLTLPYVLKTHEILMRNINPQIAGKIRKIDVAVARKLCPSAKEVNTMIKRWVRFAGKPEGMTEETIKALHVQFEFIHPFEDGNGRVGRILMNWHRIKNNLPILVIQEEEKYKYYEWFL